MNTTTTLDGDPEMVGCAEVGASGPTLLRAIVMMATCCLAACAGERPQTTVSPQLESGVTSSNGGGTRALGNQPNVGVMTRVSQ